MITTNKCVSDVDFVAWPKFPCDICINSWWLRIWYASVAYSGLCWRI